ncbi:MAG: hypothetical protein K0R39_1769 [Symbiobacteriaceae bacterium]|jgi:hypothetical protein|nr:hypothetical protein [Symbiobacteriaceae bacterium]
MANAGGIFMLLPLLILALTTVAGPATYTDPFAYCAAVGTIDAPDARWVGDKVPVVIARALRRAFTGSAEGELKMFQRGSFWRCMGGKVYACTVGANLPCQSKANLSRTPTPAMVQHCQSNPDADFIPMYVRDRASIYDWACRAGQPVITQQITKPDAQGFLSNIWYEIKPG